METLHGVELAIAQVALVRAAVPGVVRCPVVRCAVVPFKLLLHNHAVRIATSDGAVDCLAVQVSGLGTATTLEVVGDSTGRDEADVAEWTDDVFALVDAGFEVLDFLMKI